MAPEIIRGEKYDSKVDFYSLGFIIYELFTLNAYYLDKVIAEKECKINLDLYDKKWQELIDLLLQKDFNKRPNIDIVYKYLNKNEITLTNEMNKSNNKAKTNNLLNFLSKSNQKLPKKKQAPFDNIRLKTIYYQKPIFKDIIENKRNQLLYNNRINPYLNNYNSSKDSFKSKIVNYDDIIFIQNRINQIHPKIKEVYFNLVYRASEDGDRASDFHKECDRIGPNITFIKTRSGNIFGGFTFKNW